jgi:hypothetical protein
MIKRTVAVFALAGLALFVAQATAQGSPDVPAPPRAYLCFEGSSASDITDKASAAGARGWRMISAVSHGNGSIWCFEQYAASRPALARER